MKLLWSLTLLISLVLFPSCWQKSTEETKEKKSIYLINLLDKQLYTDCHIKGSVSVPLEQLKSFVETLDKDTEIVVYCSNYMCGTSKLACKQLTAIGFTNVWAYEGGMAEWYQLGYPVQGPCTQKYLRLIVKQPSDKLSDEDDDLQVNVITADQLYKKIYDKAA